MGRLKYIGGCEEKYTLSVSLLLYSSYQHFTTIYMYTSAMLSIFGRAGAILPAVVDVSHALYA